MFSRFERMVAARYLRSGRKGGIISVIAGFSLLGVALGVAALIVVMAVMNGFHIEISAKMTGFNGDILVSSQKGYIDDFDKVVSKITELGMVTSASPLIEGQVMVTSERGFSSGAMVKAMRVEDLRQYKPLVSNHITAGSLDDLNDLSNALLGRELAMSLRLEPGEKVTVVSPQGTSTVIGMVPRVKVLNAASFFESGMYQYDSSTLFMPLAMAQTYFKLPARVNLIEVMTKDREKAPEVAVEILKLLGPGYRVIDWQTIHGDYFKVLKTERVVMFIILTLIVMVAAFNIISSLIMLVKDKTQDIAILRTMGASQSAIMRIFLLCGSFIGLSGTFLGVGLGLSFALNIDSIRKGLEKLTGGTIFDPVIYYLSALPSSVQSQDVINIVLMAVGLSLVATIYPAKKAASLEPIEGLKRE